MNGARSTDGIGPARGFRRHASRGFSLVESLVAVSILALVFTAIAASIGAGSATAGEARQSIAASLATDELLIEVLATSWDEMPSWHGFEETAGESKAPDGQMELARKNLLRSVSISEESIRLEPVGIEMNGRLVRVTTTDSNGRTVIELERFVPNPTELAE